MDGSHYRARRSEECQLHRRVLRCRGGHRLSAALGTVTGRALLEVGQDLSSAPGEYAWDPGEFGNVDAVGTICPAWHDAMQKDHAVTFFEHVHTGAENARQMFGQRGQLVEVCGEERAATETRRVVQILHGGAGDGQSVPR